MKKLIAVSTAAVISLSIAGTALSSAAGRYCKVADVGKQMTASNGRTIVCTAEGSRARWRYAEATTPAPAQPTPAPTPTPAQPGVDQPVTTPAQPAPTTGIKTDKFVKSNSACFAHELNTYGISRDLRVYNCITWGYPNSPDQVWAAVDYTDPPSDVNLPQRQAVRIVKVIDGDTMKVRNLKRNSRSMTGKAYNVRVVGIDTPETRKPRVKVECGGKEATKMANKLVRRAKGYAVLVADPTQANKDKYGRGLGYIMLGKRGTTDLGRALISRGLAMPYVYNDRPAMLNEQYQKLAGRAMANAVGVFAKCGGDFHSEQPGGEWTSPEMSNA